MFLSQPLAAVLGNTSGSRSFSGDDDVALPVARRLLPDRLGIPGADGRTRRRCHCELISERHDRSHDPPWAAQQARPVEPRNNSLSALSHRPSRSGYSSDRSNNRLITNRPASAGRYFFDLGLKHSNFACLWAWYGLLLAFLPPSILCGILASVSFKKLCSRELPVYATHTLL